MVLSDKEIIRELLNGNLIISPITNGKLQIGNSSVDIRLGSIFRHLKVVNQTHFDISNITKLKREIEEYSEEIVLQPLDPFILHPKDFVLASTLEYLKLPLNLAARLEGRSPGTRIGQLVFYKMDNSVSSYKEKDGSKFYGHLGPTNSSFYQDYDYKNIINAKNHGKNK